VSIYGDVFSVRKYIQQRWACDIDRCFIISLAAAYASSQTG